MGRIEAQDVDSKELVRHVLLWIIYVKRYLTTVELQHAYVVEVGKPKLDKENLL